MNRIIFLVDMQTFYASCEKADHPEWRTHPLIVAGDPKQRSGIVLAACPLAKSRGVSTAEPVGQALAKCPEAIVVRPRMQHYLDVSLKITRILGTFTDLVEPYSVDEQFIDITGSLHFFASPADMAAHIQKTLLDQTGIYARIGIGPNKSLAKMACDNFSKKNASGIFELRVHTLASDLWPLPIGELLGVGQRMERHLLGMGIRQIGHLAHYPVEQLRRRWGVNGELLWLTARGIDTSPVSPGTFSGQKAIGHHMTLPFDYTTLKDIRIILLELSEEVAYRARKKNYRGEVVSIAVTGSFDRHTGFARQLKLPFSTNFGMDIYRAANHLFTESWDRLPVRGVAVTLSMLHPSDVYQLDLFNALEEKEKLSTAVDALYQKYGRTVIFRGVSLLPASQLHMRAGKIGGHFK
ncbi:DNA polymerase IV [Sporolactobacillus spathodeae]|uniref:DNA polymerase IV n=1 Tax=Sporolactobacillus spathodeae TaxID=1465502 RepID=A0ABS2Q8F5_9BACL|nr:DNA polymerase IV [Sporolactobacillus spathodeae]MBM7658073.1 DNA polymerase-4/DNA polymerase V [Sporolactobacillus spathodeae]